MCIRYITQQMMAVLSQCSQQEWKSRAAISVPNFSCRACTIQRAEGETKARA